MTTTGAKQMRPIIDELKTQGWEVTLTTAGHYKAVPPDKTKKLIHFSTSDDYHAYMNTIKALKLQGFEWPAKSKKDLAGERRKEGTSVDWNGQAVESWKALRDLDAAAASAVPAPANAPAEPAASPLEPPEAKMDRLYAELKEARSYHALTVDHVKECEAAFEEAKKQLEGAREENSRAAAALADKKGTFDAAFTAAA